MSAGRGPARANASSMSPLRTMSPARRAAFDARIVRLYVGDELSGIAIGDRLGIHPATVSKIIKARALTRPIGSHLKPHKRGVPWRQPGSWSPSRPGPAYYATREFARMIAPRVGTGPGTAAADFARRSGIKVETLRSHLRALGVAPRYGTGAAKLTLDQAVAIKRGLVRGTTLGSWRDATTCRTPPSMPSP